MIDSERVGQAWGRGGRGLATYVYFESGLQLLFLSVSFHGLTSTSYVYFESGRQLLFLSVSFHGLTSTFSSDPLDVMHVPVQVAREPEERSSIDCTPLQLPHLLPTRLTEPYRLSDTSNHSTNNEVANH